MIATWRWLALAGLAGASLQACATPPRLPAVPSTVELKADTGLGQVRYLVARETETFAAEARAALARELAWRESQALSGPLPPATFLAISGGGDNGAYGAGLLNGWTATGTRPQFKVVTGVSTGALIAPFAFLGPRYDHVLERVYTTTSQHDIFKKRGMLKGLFGDAMADSRPLAELINGYVTEGLLSEIAAEHAKGRELLVATANLDSSEPVIWDMTAIAGSRSPRAISLFRSILLASASIPGAFPPVMIDVSLDGRPHQEMHVDGGTMAQVFFYPPSFSSASLGATAASRERSLYVIRNARLDPDWANVDRRTLSIATRAIASLTRTQGMGDLYRIYTTTQRDGIDFNLTYIPARFNAPHREEFDTEYMRALYALGFARATESGTWEKAPPGMTGTVLGERPGN